jgi:GPCR-chaperone
LILSNRYEFKVELESTFRLKRATYYTETWESYEKKLRDFHRNPEATCEAPELPNPPNQKEAPSESAKNTTLRVKYNNKSLDLKEGTPEVKKSTVFVWITEQTEIKFAEVLPIIASISTGNKVLSEVMKYMETPELSSLFAKGFVIKIQFPLAFSIRANIFFHSMTFLKGKSLTDCAGLFTIPSDYKHLSRKEAQKTIQRPKKLVLLGQALI